MKRNGMEYRMELVQPAEGLRGRGRRRVKGARLVPALLNAPAAIYCLKPSAGSFMRPDPNTERRRLPILNKR